MKFFRHISGIIASLVLFLLTISFSFQEASENEKKQLKEIANSIEGLTQREKDQLANALLAQFSSEIAANKIEDPFLEGITCIVTAGLFEEASYNTIADVAYKVYLSERNGAPAELVEDLAFIGFARSITQEQLEAAANALSQLIAAGIDAEICQELITYGVYNEWPGETLIKVSQGIIRGDSLGLEVPRLALALLIGVDQEQGVKSVDAIVTEAIDFIKDYRRTDKSEFERREVSYKRLQEAITNGIPTEIAQEVYYLAVGDKWEPAVIEAVFQGLIKGQQQGLTLEKLAVAMIVRVEQGLGNTSPQRMVQEELTYVKNLEKQRLGLLEKDRSRYQRKNKPVEKEWLTYVQSEKPEGRMTKPRYVYYPVAQRSQINLALMEQSIRSFLGPPPTPYRWGRASRRGTDCSGFVQTVYLEQGIVLPRTSRQQYLVGRPVAGHELQFGDLVFFRKYGLGHINHVGIYVGNGRFVHASCSQGVTIGSLTKRYYRLCYAGARRIL